MVGWDEEVVLSDEGAEGLEEDVERTGEVVGVGVPDVGVKVGVGVWEV